MEPLAVRLRRAIETELHNIAFDEEVITYFEGALESQAEGQWQATDDLVEAWAPFLISHEAAADDEAAGEVCRAVLRRLQQHSQGPAAPAAAAGAEAANAAATPGEVPGLSAWLEGQKLQKYEAKAREWCVQNSVVSVSEILRQVDKFSADLQLKVLEARRVKKEAEALAAAGEGGLADPDDRRRTAAQKLLREAAAQGLDIFGPQNSDARYIVLPGDDLGCGANATVRRCILATAQNQELAVKVIPLARYTLISDPTKALARVKREIHNMKALDHPAIVKFYDMWETKETLYVVMELVEGGELFKAIIAKGHLSEPEARHIFIQLVDALKYCHAKKLIHRDLKPENILVDKKKSKDGRTMVKITDFGASKLVDDGDSTAVTVIGTRQYWAPEVSDPRTAAMGYDERVDLWSLGVVLYVMLEGCWPFEGERMDENVRTANFSFKATSATSAEARDLIRKLIQVKPPQRLSLDECRKHPWAAKDEG